MQYIYKTEYRGRSLGDRPPQDTYYNFAICIGQVARAGIAHKKLSLENLWRPGELFQIAGNLQFFNMFVNHFANASTPATVMNKEAQLIKFIDNAMDYWDNCPRYPEDQIANDKFRTKISRVATFLRKDRTLNKTTVRRIRQKTKEDWHRSCVGKFVSEEMFELLRKRALQALRGIVDTMYNKFDDGNCRDIASKRKKFESVMLNRKELVNKWNMNFIALLLVFGNGQRNQVYTFLKCPKQTELIHFEESKGGSQSKEALKIPIHEDEKRPRDSRMPFLMVDPTVFPYVKFHATFFLPFLLSKYRIDKRLKDSEKLILDTRNGKAVNSDNIRSTLSSWVNFVAPGNNITPMDLRSSYATIMVRRHAQRLELDGDSAFKNLSEEDFITMLAAMMGTSAAQIRQVYASSSHAKYADHVAEVMGIVVADEKRCE